MTAINHVRTLKAAKDKRIVARTVNWTRSQYGLNYRQALTAKLKAASLVGDRTAFQLRMQHATARRAAKLSFLESQHPGLLVDVATQSVRNAAARHGISKSYVHKIRVVLVKYAAAGGKTDNEHDLAAVARTFAVDR